MCYAKKHRVKMCIRDRARTAPEMLCHTENTAPGMVASGYCAKWAAAREVARPEFCIPTSMEICLLYTSRCV